MGRYDVLLQQDRKQEAATTAKRTVPDPLVRKKAVTTSATPGSPPVERPASVSVPQPKPNAPASAKRSFARRSFDFYEDQVSYLTRASLEERLAGREGSMNAMVRDAVDDYIKKRIGGR